MRGCRCARGDPPQLRSSPLLLIMAARSSVIGRVHGLDFEFTWCPWMSRVVTNANGTSGFACVVSCRQSAAAAVAAGLPIGRTFKMHYCKFNPCRVDHKGAGAIHMLSLIHI